MHHCMLHPSNIIYNIATRSHHTVVPIGCWQRKLEEGVIVQRPAIPGVQQDDNPGWKAGELLQRTANENARNLSRVGPKPKMDEAKRTEAVPFRRERSAPPSIQIYEDAPTSKEEDQAKRVVKVCAKWMKKAAEHQDVVAGKRKALGASKGNRKLLERAKAKEEMKKVKKRLETATLC